MSHFYFSTLSQCRPTFFIVKHKTAHKYAAKKFFFGTHREQYSTVNRVIPLFSQTIFTISVSCSAAQISLEMTILLLLSPPPSHPLPPPCPSPPPPCPPTPPPPCPGPSCPPLPPPLSLTPLLLWLLISSKFSIIYQTKQRLKALLCCSPHCKWLNRPECLEI